MEYVKVDYDELYHHGTKGMKWGIRRYQNKDGSLTPEGKKRRSLGQVIKDHKTAKTRKANLEKARAAKAAKKAEEESVAEQRKRVLNSTDPKEVYENRHLLSYAELNERVNRIDLETRLSGKIVQEYKQTGLDRVNSMMNKTANTIGNANNLFRKVDDAYSTVSNSAIGKTLAKKLGLEPPKKEFNPVDFLKNIHLKSTPEVIDFNKRMASEASGRKYLAEIEKMKNADQQLKDAQKQVDEYNKSGAKNDRVTSNTYHKTGDEIQDNKTPTGKASKNRLLLDAPAEKVEGEVEWYDRSKASTYQKKAEQVIDGEFREVEISGVPAVVTRRGETAVSGLLEDKQGR